MAGWRASSRWTGAALLVAGFLAAVRAAISVFRLQIGPVGALGGGAFIVVLSLVGVAVHFVVRFWVWELGKDGPGSKLLWLAAICGGLVLLTYPIAFLLPWVSEAAMQWVIPAANYGSVTLFIVVTALFASGLLRSGLVPRWVGKLGIVAALAGVSFLVPGSLFGALLGAVRSSVGSLDAAFILAVGASLVRRPEAEGSRVARPWVVATVVLVATVAVGTVGYIAASAQARAAEAFTPTSPFPPVFSRIFSGFTNASEFDEFLPADYQGTTISTFDLSRTGDTVMPVDFSNSADLSGADGKVHGKVIGVDVPDHGRWYLVDNYFVESPESQFASVPRTQKLALWDAFASAHPTAVRILGVFPSGLVVDRSLLRPDGYGAKDLVGSTLVIYTPEMDSGIAEELSWASPDQLIANGRAYEAESATGAGDTANRLYVDAFTWDGSAWHPAVRSISRD
jgi:hypothetical protein